MAVVVILGAASWLALIIVTRIDEVALPGQQLNVGGLSILPGVEDHEGAIEGRINILVMGLDRRPDEGTIPTRTDSIFILTIDPQTKTAGILSMPRDLYVEIPNRSGGGFHKDRINSVWYKGETLGYDGGGPKLLRQVMERNLGVEIHHYLIVDFEAFVDVIETLGGIDVFVPERVSDPVFLALERQDRSPVVFNVGLQHMDGPRALAYARIRYGSSDLERVERQQRVIFAAIAKAKELDLINVNKLIDLANQFNDAVETDISEFQMLRLAPLAVQIDADRIPALSLGAATTPWTAPSGAAVLLFDEVMVRGIVSALFNDQGLVEDNALIEVQNGAGADGLAGRAVDYLTGLGFPARSLVAASVADGGVHPLTEIIDFSGKAYSVQRLAAFLAVPPERVHLARPSDQARRTTDADILVILGEDAGESPFARGASGG
ncbi:MAG: LCP family protein [Chloroflexi bacterium]|nr:LCP family protein [Chloroflexota bacterium]